MYQFEVFKEDSTSDQTELNQEQRLFGGMEEIMRTSLKGNIARKIIKPEVVVN